MECSSLYTIALHNLPAEGVSYVWHLDDSFFEALDQCEIGHGSIDATLRVTQTAGAFELDVRVAGSVEIPCDRCLEPMSQPIDAQATLKARLGETFDDDGDIITVPADSEEFDVAWNLYEVIALDIPIHHVHPDGACPVDVAAVLASSEEQQPAADVHSPFAGLKELLNSK